MRNKNHHYLFSFIFPALASASYADSVAQLVERGDTVLKTVTVSGTQPIRKSYYPRESSGGLTGFKTEPKDIAQAFSTISGQQLKDQGITNLTDAMRKTAPGVNVVKISGAMRFKSRGFYMDKIQEDGANLVSAGSANADKSLLTNPYALTTMTSDVAIYDHIEVLRGPSGLMQGTGEPSGSVNLVRKRPTKHFQLETETTTGSWQLARQVVDVSGPLNQDKTLTGRLVGAYEHGNSFKDSVHHKSGTLYGDIQYQSPDNKTTVNLGASYDYQWSMPDYGVPLRAFKGIYVGDSHLPRSTYLGANFNYQNPKRTAVFFDLQHQFNDNWDLDTKFQYAKVHGQSDAAFLYFPSGIDYQCVTLTCQDIEEQKGVMAERRLFDYSGEHLSFSTRLNGKFHWGGDREHQVFAQFSTNLTDLAAKTEEYSASGKSLTRKYWHEYNPSVAESAVWPELSQINNTTTSFIESSLSLGGRFELVKNLHLIVAGNYTNYSAKYSREQTLCYSWSGCRTYPTKLNTSHHHFSPRYALSYQFTPNTTAYLSYTSIFKPQFPAGSVVSGYSDKLLLPPMVGSNYEVGVKHSFADGTGLLSLSVFKMHQRNRPQAHVKYIGTGSFPRRTTYYTPQGEIESKGLELELAGKLTPRWDMALSYTMSSNKYLQNESLITSAGSNASPDMPKRMLRLSTSYNLPFDNDKWVVGVGVQAHSSTESSSHPIIRQGGLAVWDAWLSYAPSRNWSVNLLVNNVFDRRYYEINGEQLLATNNFYGAPRNWKLSIQGHF